jgi:hypothetical protein
MPKRWRERDRCSLQIASEYEASTQESCPRRWGRKDLSGDTCWKSYFKSVRNCNVEAVFSASDPFPGLAEVALIPYLALKRGF